MDAVDDGSIGFAPPPERDGVGAFLRARRLELGLTHGDVANAVKLSARRIQSLEDERWDDLPDGPFLRGLMRNVARALDLDAASLMERVDASLMRARNPDSILVSPQALHGTMPRRNGPLDDRHGGRRLIFGAFAFAVVAALIAWSGTQSFDRMVTTGRSLLQAPTATATARQSTPAAEAPVSPAAETASNDAAAAPVPSSAVPAVTESASSSPLALLFHFNEESWVEVRAADGHVLLKSLNAAGSDQQVEGEAPYSVVVGNAKGVALRFRGQPVDLGPYTHDQVARLTLS